MSAHYDISMMISMRRQLHRAQCCIGMATPFWVSLWVWVFVWVWVGMFVGKCVWRGGGGEVYA